MIPPEATPYIVAGIVILNGWLLWRSQEGKRDREGIRSEQSELRNSLFEFKEKVARDHVTFNALSKVEERVVNAIERLGDRLDRLFEGKKSP